MEIRRRVGYVPERPTLYEWMTVERDRLVHRRFLWPELSRRATAGWSPIRLPVKRKIKALSKGMRAKVSLAAGPGRPAGTAGARRADLRPGRHGAPRVPGKHGRSGRGRADRVLSSHQIGEVERVADIVAILRKGQLLLVERLDDLKAEVREVTFTLTNGAASPPGACPARSLIRRHEARQWQYLVRGLGDEQVAALSHDPAARLWRAVRSLEGSHCLYGAGCKRQRQSCRGGGGPMNDRVFWRLVWKECRREQPLWMAMGAAALAGQLLVLCWPKGTFCEKIPILFGTGLALADVYALGCGATLFATERETGTFEFQRALPDHRRAGLLGQTGLGRRGSVAALMILLWGTAWVLC